MHTWRNVVYHRTGPLVYHVQPGISHDGALCIPSTKWHVTGRGPLNTWYNLVSCDGALCISGIVLYIAGRDPFRPSFRLSSSARYLSHLHANTDDCCQRRYREGVWPLATKVSWRSLWKTRGFVSPHTLFFRGVAERWGGGGAKGVAWRAVVRFSFFFCGAHPV